MPPCSLPMREELPPIRMKDECRRTSANRGNKDHRRCGSSKSAKLCVTPMTTTDPLSRLASLLQYRSCKDIIIMAGAGISTASGIPDFRSPGTGLYYNTSKYNVSSPTDVFDLKYFNKNPYPFMDIIRDFIKTEKNPNSTHGFCKLLETKGLLLRMYTQNIDGLEKKSGISPTRLVEAHGTMETASCVKCFTSHSTTWTEKMIMSGKVPSCKRKVCSGYVKPDVIMFGEELPKKFYLYPKDFEKCDLLLIMGTSLNVEPFSELVDSVPKSVPRVLLNRDAVGPFNDSRRKNDIFIRGDISTSINKLVKMLGWSKALNGVICASDRERSSSRADSRSSDQTITESRTNINSNTPDLTKSISNPTWACCRTNVVKGSNLTTQDSLSLPNSVVRNFSDQSLLQKVSSLSLSESISTISKASTRRSVSAPLPKYTTSKTTVNNFSPSSCSPDELLTNSDVDNIVSTVLSTASSKSTFIGQDMINVQDDEGNKNPNTGQNTPVLNERRVRAAVKKYNKNTVVDHESLENENFLKMKVLKSDEDVDWTLNPSGISAKQIHKPLPLITEQAVIKETLFDTVQTVMSTYSNLSIQNINSTTSSFSSHSEQSSFEINTLSSSCSRLSVTKMPITLVRRRNLGKKAVTLNCVPNKKQLPSTQINTQRSFSNLLKPDTSDILKAELKTFITKKLKASSIRNEKQVKERKYRKNSDSPSGKKKLPFTVPVTASTVPKDRRASPGKSRKSSTKPTKELHQWKLSPSEVEILAKSRGHIPSTLSLGVGKKFVNNGISSKSWTPIASTKNAVTRRNVKKQIVLYSVGISSKPDFKWIKNKQTFSP